MARRSAAAVSAGEVQESRPAVVDLERYTPAYFTWIANKLAHGASRAYREAFSVGIESWRLLVLLAIEPRTAQAICRIIGMDKASVSRTLKSMHATGLISIGLDPQDGRLRVATITRKGRDAHDRILSLALERERALLSVLSPSERASLISMLKRLHENLPVVEQKTAEYLALNYPRATRSRRLAPVGTGSVRSRSAKD